MLYFTCGMRKWAPSYIILCMELFAFLSFRQFFITTLFLPPPACQVKVKIVFYELIISCTIFFCCWVFYIYLLHNTFCQNRWMSAGSWAGKIILNFDVANNHTPTHTHTHNGTEHIPESITKVYMVCMRMMTNRRKARKMGHKILKHFSFFLLMGFFQINK